MLIIRQLKHPQPERGSTHTNQMYSCTSIHQSIHLVNQLIINDLYYEMYRCIFIFNYYIEFINTFQRKEQKPKLTENQNLSHI